MSRGVVVFGTGVWAEVVGQYFLEDSDHEVVGFTVEEKYLTDGEFMGRPVVPFERIDREFPPAKCAVFVAIAYADFNRARTRIYGECKEKGYQFVSYVSPQAIFRSKLEIGENTFVCENSVIQTGVSLGNNAIIRSGCNIGHHTQVGDHCFIASGAVIAGKCIIEAGCFVGVNATVADRIRLAQNCIVGAGALILHDTVENGVYRGNETVLAGLRGSRSRSL